MEVDRNEEMQLYFYPSNEALLLSNLKEPTIVLNCTYVVLFYLWFYCSFLEIGYHINLILVAGRVVPEPAHRRELGPHHLPQVLRPPCQGTDRSTYIRS